MTVYSFKEEELSGCEMYPGGPGAYGIKSQPTRKFKTPITPKENMLRVYRGEKPVWLPNAETECNLVQPEVMLDAFARNYGGVDWFGIEWEYEPLTNAAMVKPGTRRLSEIMEWENELEWPDLNAIDWAKDFEENYKDAIDPDRATNFIIVNGLFERTADLTSFNDTFIYLLTEAEVLDAFYEKLTRFHIDLMKIAKEYYHADVITFHDDMGSQQNAFMSPDTFTEVLLPHYKRMNEAAHQMGLYVNFHSCGNVVKQIPNFMKAGFDSWEGQLTCNDMQAIMDEYGDDLAQFNLWFLTPEITDEEIDIQTDEMLDGIAKTGRLITRIVDLNPERADESYEKIYVKSRKYYAQQ